jgi:outer membrane protein assembly factor BamB
MGRLLNIWRSWSVAQRLALVGGVTLVIAGAAVVAYLVTKRPADVSNSQAVFVKQKQTKKKPETLDWPMYGYDPARTRYLPVNGLNPPFGASLWSFQAGQLLEFQPIVVHGTIYFMDKNATFYALSVHGGHIEWKRDIGSLNASSPAYWHHKLFAVNLEPQQAVALDAKKKGKVLWRTPLPGRSESSPLIHNGKVIFGCESGDIFALDAQTGKVRWTVHTGGAVKGALAYDNGTLFADNYAGEVWAIDAGNGHVKWTAHTQGGGFLHGGGVYSTPAVAFGRVYLGGLDGRVYSFVEKTGALAWSHSTGAEVYSSPAVADTPHAPPTVFIGSEDKHFYALDARTGAVRWEHFINGIILGSPSVVDRTVYVSGIGPNIGTFGYAVNKGQEVFTNSEGEYNPVISDGKRIYLTGTSTIRAFKPETKAELKRKRAKARTQHKHGSKHHGGNAKKGGAHNGSHAKHSNKGAHHNRHAGSHQAKNRKNGGK